MHDSTTALPSSVRLLLALAAIMDFDVCTEDVSQGYLQSANELMREVYIKPNKQLYIPAVHVLKLLRPLYGLADSGDYWNAAFAEHFKGTLGISLFFRLARRQLVGLIATYVDDALACGD